MSPALSRGLAERSANNIEVPAQGRDRGIGERHTCMF